MLEWEPIRVGGAIKKPAKLKDAKPLYPPDARAARVQGIVIVEVTTKSDGTIKDVKVMRSVPLLDAAAVAAVKQWVYAPAVVRGTQRPVIFTETVVFSTN